MCAHLQTPTLTHFVTHTQQVDICVTACHQTVDRCSQSGVTLAETHKRWYLLFHNRNTNRDLPINTATFAYSTLRVLAWLWRAKDEGIVFWDKHSRMNGNQEWTAAAVLPGTLSGKHICSLPLPCRAWVMSYPSRLIPFPLLVKWKPRNRVYRRCQLHDTYEPQLYRIHAYSLICSFQQGNEMVTVTRLFSKWRRSYIKSGDLLRTKRLLRSRVINRSVLGAKSYLTEDDTW